MPIAQTILAGIIAGFLIGNAFGQSPEPTETNQSPQVDQVPNAHPPVVINVQAAPKTEAEIQEERHEREEKAKLDRRLVDLTAELSTYTGDLFRATVVLAIATGLLVLATGGLIAAAIRQEWWARKHERAYVIAGPGTRGYALLSRRWWQRKKVGPINAIGITAGNYGRTVAFIKEISYGLCSEDEWPLAAYPPFQVYEDALYPTMRRDEVYSLNIPLLPITGTATKICYGRIVYNDIFGVEHFSSWKHRIYPDRGHLSIALPGCYSSAWDRTKKQKKTDPP